MRCSGFWGGSRAKRGDGILMSLHGVHGSGGPQVVHGIGGYLAAVNQLAQ